MMDTSAIEVVFEILQTEVAFLANHTYKMPMGIKLNKSTLYSAM